MSLAGFMIYSKNILISKHNLPKFFLLTHTFMNWGWGRGSVGSTTVPALHRVIGWCTPETVALGLEAGGSDVQSCGYCKFKTSRGRVRILPPTMYL